MRAMSRVDPTPIPSGAPDPASWIDTRPVRRPRSDQRRGYDAIAARLDDLFVTAISAASRPGTNTTADDQTELS